MFGASGLGLRGTAFHVEKSIDTRSKRCLVIYRPPGPAACGQQLAGDRPGLLRGQEDRNERDLRSVHHAADGIAARRVWSKVPSLRLFRRYAQLGGAGGEQARRALGAGRAGMDAVDRDPKRRRLRDAAITIPENTTFVPVDFEKSTVKSALLEAGLDPIAPAFLSMLGVSQYLTEEALDETLDMVRVMVPSSQIVFSFVLRDGDLPEDEAAWAREDAEFCAAKGEPWLTRLGPDQLRLKLLKIGFSKVSHLSSEEADQLYFRGRPDGLRMCTIEQMMRAIV